MTRAAVFYATREGQARRVAERIAGDLRAHRVMVDVIDVKDLRGSVEWPAYSRAYVVASVHAGRHAKEMIAFVRRFKEELSDRHAPFLSLTLSQAGAELASNSLVQRETARGDALRMITDFMKDTGWRPERTLPVAGALAYSKYNFLVKWIMKRIAHNAGFDGPTSRDYEFTNWPAVDRFVTVAP
ncbi:MAG TPA: flavodoxin domain-containing protein [Gemmatimonadaceae bacterium]|nr:flavodoxin domain-containing protein [Gemmatimonadaceae bacterium]